MGSPIVVDAALIAILLRRVGGEITVSDLEFISEGDGTFSTSRDYLRRTTTWAYHAQLPVIDVESWEEDYPWEEEVKTLAPPSHATTNDDHEG